MLTPRNGACRIITFLPYASFDASARCLDNKRLGKQRLEALQLLDALMGFAEGWKDHPAAEMWRGSEHWLAKYGISICQEWLRRGFRDSMLATFQRRADALPVGPEPWWLGDERLHSSHRANLVRKDRERYATFLGFKESPMDGYFWPGRTP